MPRDGLILPDPVRHRAPTRAVPELQSGFGDTKIFFSKFTWATLTWNESTINPAQLPFRLLDIQFQNIVMGLKLWVLATDDGVNFKSPALTDLYLYGGVDDVQDMLFAFNYQDHLRSGNGWANLPAPIPISLLCSVNRLRFSVGLQPSAFNTATGISGNNGAEVEQTRQAAVNSKHLYGIRIHAFTA